MDADIIAFPKPANKTRRSRHRKRRAKIIRLSVDRSATPALDRVAQRWKGHGVWMRVASRLVTTGMPDIGEAAFAEMVEGLHDSETALAIALATVRQALARSKAA